MGGVLSCSPKPPPSDAAPLAAAADRLRASSLQAHLSALREALSEPTALLVPDDELYRTARTRPYNLDFRSFPLIIVQPRTTADVQAAVNFVREHGHGVPLCVTSGAHSNRCMVTDSVVIDLRRMNGVTVDPAARTATVQGGAYLGELDAACAPHDLATTAGTYPETGMGLMLAGGFGWLARKHGLGVDNLKEVEVVLPDGRAVVANEDNEHADLLWASRGGGGNFGVVVRFVFSLHPIPRSILGGMKVFMAPTLASASALVTKYDATILSSPDFGPDCSSALLLPAGAPVVVTVWAYTGTAHTRAADVPIFRAADALGGWFKVQNDVRPMPYHSGLQRITQAVSHGGFIYTSLVQIGSFDAPLPAVLFEALVRHTKASPHAAIDAANSFVMLFPMGGRARTAAADAKTCIDADVRSARFFVILEAQWRPGTGDAGRDAARAWVRAAIDIVSPYRTAPLRYAPDAVVGGDASPSATGATRLTDVAAHDIGLGNSIYERLRLVKGRYDPANVFRMNQNVPPLLAAAAAAAEPPATAEPLTTAEPPAAEAPTPEPLAEAPVAAASDVLVAAADPSSDAPATTAVVV